MGRIAKYSPTDSRRPYLLADMPGNRSRIHYQDHAHGLSPNGRPVHAHGRTASLTKWRTTRIHIMRCHIKPTD